MGCDIVSHPPQITMRLDVIDKHLFLHDVTRKTDIGHKNNNDTLDTVCK